MATQQEKTGQKRLKKPSTSAMILLLFAITVVSFSGITLSKYILQVDSKEQLVTATEFYFESDLLSESSYPTYTMEYRDSLTIDLKNYLDDLNVSAETISYDVTVAVDGVVAEDITVT